MQSAKAACWARQTHLRGGESLGEALEQFPVALEEALRPLDEAGVGTDPLDLRRKRLDDETVLTFVT